MDYFFAKDYQGAPFELFGSAHIASLLLVLAVSLVLIRTGRHLSYKPKFSIGYALAACLLVNELSWHVWSLVTGEWTLARHLPLHLCSIMVWVCIAGLMTGDRRLFGIMYFLGVAGAAQALITPDAGDYGFPHFLFFQTMISHGLVFVAGVYVAAVNEYRPTFKTAVRIFVGLNAYALVVGVINALLGSNYLFIAAKPESASLMDVMPAWPWYIAILEVLAILLLLLLAAPFETRANKALVTHGTVSGD